jgi:hypothetical protein
MLVRLGNRFLIRLNLIEEKAPPEIEKISRLLIKKRLMGHRLLVRLTPLKEFKGVKKIKEEGQEER